MKPEAIAALIKKARSDAGLTQFELAHMAEVSLPTVQNIEAEKANPSLSTLGSLFRVLGYEIEVKYKSRVWDLLSVCGAPLLLKAATRGAPTKSLLFQ